MYYPVSILLINAIYIKWKLQILKFSMVNIRQNKTSSEDEYIFFFDLEWCQKNKGYSRKSKWNNTSLAKQNWGPPS